MKNSAKTVKKWKLPFPATFLFSILCSVAVAQKPAIKVIDKVSGSMSETVVIKGNTFGTDATKLAVFFGATKGAISSITDQLIEVSIPAGSTYNNVSVTNTALGLSTYSREQFSLSFSGDPGIDISNLQGQTDFDAESGLYDICMSDLDGDKKVDIVAANNNNTSISILTNTSTGPGNINFTKIIKALGAKSLHIKCSDLNGDGKPDLIITEGNSGVSDQIFIFQNTSTGPGSFTFGTAKVIKLTGRKPIRIETADMDLDGKPEIIFTDQTSNKVGLLANQSSLATITMSTTPFDIVITGAASTDGLAVQDLNGDFLPEIVTSQFQTNNSNLFIVGNKSTTGVYGFNDALKLTVGNTVKRIRVGDLDGDSKPDIAVTQLLGSAVTIFLNNSIGNALAFSSPTVVATDNGPWGIDFGDLDGDGKTDIVVASVINPTKSLTILNNKSNPGSLAFDKIIVPTTFVNRHVNIGDLDGDGKPDIAFASVDDASAGLASKVSIFRNKKCLIPNIDPVGPLNICTGFPLKLETTVGGGVTYDWKNGAATVKSGTASFFDVIASGSYTVTATSEGGNCTKTSANPVDVTVDAGVANNTSPQNNGPVCIGKDLSVFVTTSTPGATYKWTGPAGYTATTTSLNAPVISNFTVANAGQYDVEVITANGCIARKDFTIVQAIDVPDFRVQFTGSPVICSGTKTLSIVPQPAGFSYQWFEKTLGQLNGETNPSALNVSASGEYYASATFSGCGTTQITSAKITFATAPTADFEMPTDGCMGQDIQFTNKSTSDPNVQVSYTWTFGDTKTAPDVNPKHKYTTAATFSVKLLVAYQDGGSDCAKESSIQPIQIKTAVIPTITNPDNIYKLCPGEQLKLQVLGSYTTYKWSTGSQDASIIIHEGGTYTVEVTAGSCTLNAERIVEDLKSKVTITANPLEIAEGQTSQLTVTGLKNYSWSPAETLTNPSISNPVATPSITTTYSVTGKDSADCTTTATIEIQVIGEPIVNKLKPSNLFSPNGVEPNETWIVEKILDYPKCNISIYDIKGIKVYEAKPYHNDWDGTFNGKKLPDGVYYYVIRCDGEESKPRSGSITLLR